MILPILLAIAAAVVLVYDLLVDPMPTTTAASRTAFARALAALDAK